MGPYASIIFFINIALFNKQIINLKFTSPYFHSLLYASNCEKPEDTQVITVPSQSLNQLIFQSINTY